MSAVNGNPEIRNKVELYTSYVLLAVILMVAFAVAATLFSMACPIEAKSIGDGCVQLKQGFIKSVQCHSKVENNFGITRSLD